MTTRITTPPANLAKNKFLFPFQNVAGYVNSSSTFTANRAYVQQIRVDKETVATGIATFNGATVAGTEIVALYGPQEDTADGAALVVQATAAMSGANSPQVISFSSATTLQPGIYWLVWMTNNATSNKGRTSNTTLSLHWQRYFDTAGTLTDPIPATSAMAGNVFPFCHLVCSS